MYSLQSVVKTLEFRSGGNFSYKELTYRFSCKLSVIVQYAQFRTSLSYFIFHNYVIMLFIVDCDLIISPVGVSMNIVYVKEWVGVRLCSVVNASRVIVILHITTDQVKTPTSTGRGKPICHGGGSLEAV